ncbi:MAG: hypothetical protein SF029_10690 [bacterium]|nr:hypothetical protein [bacterium]
MSRSAASAAQSPTPDTGLSESAAAFLTQECDRMLNLYTQAQGNAQNVFNFYLTFVTTVIGAIIVIAQAAPGNAAWTLAGVLFFAVIVGSVYLSALSGRYAHAYRYARAVDELRRFLIQRLNVPVPAGYQPFLSGGNRAAQGRAAWFYWLFPTGTYQMFIAVVNSTALAAAAGLIFVQADAAGARQIVAMVLVFVLTLSVSNIYSHLVIQRFAGRLGVDLWNDSPAWASRE